ncbi:MAG TPA: class I SAM-dependent methyltransferase, partial [Candidatus Glassbacteria bacterium]|nr:class I SAM-dependent methyltransferase [Candidatus Glassbacteria bacterium]
MPHICHWKHNYLLDNWLRRRLQPPGKILNGYLRPGMTVLDAGCGMGLFSLPMAALVGGTGRVIAVDLQPEGLKVLMRRAVKAGLAGRIRPIACDMGELPVREKIDFALAFYSVHEVPDFSRFFRRIAGLLNPEAKLLVC